jgi:hypothetical protein
MLKSTASVCSIARRLPSCQANRMTLGIHPYFRRREREIAHHRRIDASDGIVMAHHMFVFVLCLLNNFGVRCYRSFCFGVTFMSLMCLFSSGPWPRCHSKFRSPTEPTYSPIIEPLANPWLLQSSCAVLCTNICYRTADDCL